LCACAFRDAVRALGLDVRAGLHTGEVELRGDDIAGVAVASDCPDPSRRLGPPRLTR
jgi:class 3 adenylate cyclase